MNYLNIPECNFGSFGINTGNLIYKAVKSINPNAVIKFDPSKDCIIISNLAEMTLEQLGDVLYGNGQASKYHGWFPKVEEKKDPNGNFLVKFHCLPSRIVTTELDPLDPTTLREYLFC